MVPHPESLDFTVFVEGANVNYKKSYFALRVPLNADIFKTLCQTDNKSNEI